MKKIILSVASLLALTGTAMAEDQIYNPYGGTSLYPTYEAASQQARAVQHRYEQPDQYMVYPGREQYGEHFGSIPRHPGDYRDAVDRGAWTAGGGGQRSFDIR